MMLGLKTNTKSSHPVDHCLTGNVSLDNGYIIYKYIFFLLFLYIKNEIFHSCHGFFKYFYINDLQFKCTADKHSPECSYQHIYMYL